MDGEAVFPCHRWLAKNEDDGAIERTLPLLGAIGVVEATTTYIVEVKTGTVRKAGTDANVHLTLFGETLDSGLHKLAKSETFRDKFEAGHTDRFRFESVDLGALRKVVIGHDGAGFGAGWFLENVTVEVPSDGRRYTFPCSRWFAKGEDDGLLERELHADAEKGGVARIEETDSYECRVHTSNVSGAGTDSRVYAVFYGTEGKTDEMPLANKTDNFEKGMTDTFKLELEKIGELTKMRIWHDNHGLGSAWHLGFVEMESLKSHKVFTFRADRWLSKKEGLLAEIPVAEVTEVDEEGNRVEVEVEEQDLVTYEVRVFTANVEKAGTDAHVSITLYGEVDGVKVDTGERKLAKSSTYSDKFERGHTDVFSIQCVSLGDVKKVKIWHDNKGLKLGGNQWLCEKIVVVDPSEDGKAVEFPCGMWLSKAEGLIRELLPKRVGPLEEASAETVRYIINVHTSDIRWAGTDATVALVLYGEDGDSGAIPLTHSETNRDKFERGKIDKFIYEAADLGDLKKLRIGHDNAGGGADWHLDKVEVDAPAVGKQWVFPCNRWFAKGKDDSALERVLVPKSESGDPDDESGGVTVYRAKQPYEVQVYTSNVSNAGTENPVTMCLYGKDELGVDLNDEFAFPKHNFRKGAGIAEGSVPDKFNFDIADVGVPYKLRVSVKPTGTLFSTCSWHLDKVVLFDQKRNERLEFRCEKWISTDNGKDGGQTSRELVLHERLGVSKDDPTKLEEKRKSRPTATQKDYLVSVTTGTEKSSGTDANVFIDIVGKEGSTGDRQLKSSKTHFDKFEKGHTDEFVLQDIVDLGELKEITIRHDNKGSLKSGAAWFCENVTISIVGDESKKWDFLCKQWLSTKKGDGKIHKTVPVYKDPALLTNEATVARKRAKDAAHKLKGLGDGVSKEQRAKMQVDVARLLKDAEEAEHELAVANGGAALRGDLTDYELLVVTGSKSNSGTVARVFVEIMGIKTGNAVVSTNSASVAATEGDVLTKYKVVVKTKPGGGEVHGDAVLLVKGTDNECAIPVQPDGVSNGSGTAIKPGAVHEAVHEFPALGAIKTVSVQVHPRNGNDPSAAVWGLEAVEIYDVNAGSEWMFSCPGAGVVPGALEPTPLLHAGERAGQATSTGPLELRDNKITFKTGSSDRFSLPAPDVGEITAIRVWHTGKSKKDNWYCEQITLTVRERAKVVIFPCKAWLSGTKDGKPERLLKPATSDQLDSVSLAGSRAPSPGGKSLGGKSGSISRAGSLMSLASKSGSSSSMTSLSSTQGPYVK